MLVLPITSLAAIVLSGLFVALGAVTIRRRRAARIAVGDGGDEGLTRAIRAHANLAEYGLFFLVLLGLAEANGAPIVWCALLGAAFVVGRLAHAFALLKAEPGSSDPRRFRWRVRAMMTTFVTIALAAATLLATLVRGAVLTG